MQTEREREVLRYPWGGESEGERERERGRERERKKERERERCQWGSEFLCPAKILQPG